MRIPPTAMIRTALVAALATLAISALTILLVQAGGKSAAATNLNVGLDFDTSGTPANGVYDPLNLPTFQSCGPVAIGGQISVDLFVLGVQNLLGFDSYIAYDNTRLTLVGTQVRMFMNSQPGSVMTDTSQNSPDPITGVLLTPDTDGLYDTLAADTGNVAGDTGEGVLARLTFQGIAAGQASVSIPALDRDTNGQVDTGATLRADNPANPGTTILLNDTSPADGWFDGPFTNRQGTIAVGGDADGDGVADVACPGQIADNCPGIFNNQADMEGDGQGDACDGDIDGDHYWNAQETAMGSNTTNAASTPEVCDGADNDADTQVDEGYDLNPVNGIPDCSDPNADTDGDTTMNPSDLDDDGDGTIDTTEIFIRTHTLKKCPATTTDYVWAPDMDNGKKVGISEVLLFIPYLLSKDDPNPKLSAAYNKRFDWQPGGGIGIGDILSFIPFFLVQCTP